MCPLQGSVIMIESATVNVDRQLAPYYLLGYILWITSRLRLGMDVYSSARRVQGPPSHQELQGGWGHR